MLDADCADRVAALVPLPHRARLSKASRMWRSACHGVATNVDARHMRRQRPSPRAARDLTRFVERHRRVVSLSLAGSFWLTDDRLDLLLRACSASLRSLDVQRCLLLKGNRVDNWPRGLVTLETVSCGMTSGGLENALEALPNLRTLRLGPEHIVTTPCVRTTGTYFSRVTDRVLACIRARNLAVVSLARCHDVTSVGALCGDEMEHLDIRRTAVNDAELAEALRRAPNLKRLVAGQCGQLTRKGVAAAVKAHKNLKRVEADPDVLREIVTATDFRWSFYGTFAAIYAGV